MGTNPSSLSLSGFNLKSVKWKMNQRMILQGDHTHKNSTFDNLSGCQLFFSHTLIWSQHHQRPEWNVKAMLQKSWPWSKWLAISKVVRGGGGGDVKHQFSKLSVHQKPKSSNCWSTTRWFEEKQNKQEKKTQTEFPVSNPDQKPRYKISVMQSLIYYQHAIS